MGDGFAGAEVEAVGAEELAGGEGGAGGWGEGGFEIVEVDAGEGLGDVEFAWVAIEAGAVPIEDAVGGVRVLLDFVDQESRADGVEAAGGDEDGVAGGGGEGVDEVGDGAVVDGLFEIGAGDAGFEAGVEFRAGIAIGDEPHLRFGFAAEGWGEVGGRMDLDREVVAGVEDLDQDGKARGIGEVVAENLGAVVVPEVVEGFAGEGAVADDRVGILAIDDFPGFAVGSVRSGEVAVIEGFKFAPAPDAFHVDGVEGEEGHG